MQIVKRLVELHQGTVSAKSEGPGKGSRFEVRIPFAKAVASPEIVPPQTLTQPVQRRVVVVEDNSDVRQTLAMLLTKWGHEVALAEDGPSGLDRVLHHRPDVALVDIGLPLMNGYEVARAIRKCIPAENLRLIALSGYGQRDDVARATEAGFDMHLLKPIDPDALQRLLSQ